MAEDILQVKEQQLQERGYEKAKVYPEGYLYIGNRCFVVLAPADFEAATPEVAICTNHGNEDHPIYVREILTLRCNFFFRPTIFVSEREVWIHK
jgi:hypothetical protein